LPAEFRPDARDQRVEQPPKGCFKLARRRAAKVYAKRGFLWENLTHFLDITGGKLNITEFCY
jgi:hypothetical protein